MQGGRNEGQRRGEGQGKATEIVKITKFLLRLPSSLVEENDVIYSGTLPLRLKN